MSGRVENRNRIAGGRAEMVKGLSDTVPLVLPREFVLLIRQVAAVRNANGQRVDGRRAFSMSAVVREALRHQIADWQAEVRTLGPSLMKGAAR